MDKYISTLKRYKTEYLTQDPESIIREASVAVGAFG